jgi:hypothetical protein
MHNYARWEKGVGPGFEQQLKKSNSIPLQIIGQGGPTNAQFAATWGELAAMYKSNPKIIFGL